MFVISVYNNWLPWWDMNCSFTQIQLPLCLSFSLSRSLALHTHSIWPIFWQNLYLSFMNLHTWDPWLWSPHLWQYMLVGCLLTAGTWCTSGVFTFGCNFAASFSTFLAVSAISTVCAKVRLASESKQRCIVSFLIPLTNQSRIVYIRLAPNLQCSVIFCKQAAYSLIVSPSFRFLLWNL